MRSLLYFSIILGIGVLGCSKKREHPDAKESQKAPHEAYKGLLVKQLEENRADKEALEECDHLATLAQDKLVAVLDQKKPEIEKFVIEKYKAKGTEAILDHDFKETHGISFLLRQSKFLRAKKGWKKDSYLTWMELEKQYEKTKDQPINQDWQDLNKTVRSVLDNDNDRLVYGVNFEISASQVPVLELLASQIEKCLAEDQGNCSFSKLGLNEVTKPFIEGNPYYRWYLNRIKDPTLSQDEVSKIEKRFWRRINTDNNRLNSFKKNASVKKDRVVDSDGIQRDVLSVPLATQDFSLALDELTGIIEKGWSHETLKLKVKWVPFSETLFSASNVFGIFLNREIGTRSWVSWTQGQVHLVQPILSGAIVHELGHVLGFRDTYVTTWSSGQCRYFDEYQASDIMADSYTGEVQSRHWEKLSKMY